jgi:carboxypeptidase C (cathepsin A)
VLKYETRPAVLACSGRSTRGTAVGDSTGENLRRAMAQNPFLHVMVQAGYYDGGTDYFSAKYTMWNMDPSGGSRTGCASRATAAAT